MLIYVHSAYTEREARTYRKNDNCANRDGGDENNLLMVAALL